MISIQDGRIQIVGDHRVLEVEAIALFDGMLRANLISDQTLKDIADAIYEGISKGGSQAVKGNIEEYTEHRVMTAEEVERIFGFNPAKGESPKPLTPQQMEKLIEELGMKGMTREEIIKKNLRRAMEDEWKK